MTIPRHQSVVPFAVKLIAPDGECGQSFVGDLDSRRVGILIQSGLDMQPGWGGRTPDQIDHTGSSRAGLTHWAQYGRNMRLLELVPLGLLPIDK